MHHSHFSGRQPLEPPDCWSQLGEFGIPAGVSISEQLCAGPLKRSSETTVAAVQAVRGMRGGSQSKLMIGSDRELWVVKFLNNPQHFRVLANDFIASRMAEAVGLSVPKTCAIQVSGRLIQNNPLLLLRTTAEHQEPCAPGLQFGSQYLGGRTFDLLPDSELLKVRNLVQFAGILAFDKWTCNADARQAVFRRTAKERRYQATFVDQGFCFNAGDWALSDAPLRGVYARNCVYSGVTGWDSFEPWLSYIEQFDGSRLWEIMSNVPPEWYGDDIQTLELLTCRLLRRRPQVRGLIDQFRKSDRRPFPNWITRSAALAIPFGC